MIHVLQKTYATLVKGPKGRRALSIVGRQNYPFLVESYQQDSGRRLILYYAAMAVGRVRKQGANYWVEFTRISVSPYTIPSTYPSGGREVFYWSVGERSLWAHARGRGVQGVIILL